MCRPVTCRTCSRTTWAGCGQHVAQVRSIVPADQWCTGHPEDPVARKPVGLARLFGRR